jgi:hypothetical protein
MSIDILLPVETSTRSTVRRFAVRGRTGPDAVIGLIDNGKPHAAELLEAIGVTLESRGLAGSHFVWRKPTAARPITPSERARMLARAHLVIAGVGD